MEKRVTSSFHAAPNCLPPGLLTSNFLPDARTSISGQCMEVSPVSTLASMVLSGMPLFGFVHCCMLYKEFSGIPLTPLLTLGCKEAVTVGLPRCTAYSMSYFSWWKKDQQPFLHNLLSREMRWWSTLIPSEPSSAAWEPVQNVWEALASVPSVGFCVSRKGGSNLRNEWLSASPLSSLALGAIFYLPPR